MSYICANCGAELPEDSKYYEHTHEFPGTTGYFCKKPQPLNNFTDCLTFYRKNHMEESLIYRDKGKGSTGAEIAKDLFDYHGLKADLSQSAIGAAALSIGGGAAKLIGKYNSPEAKAAREAAAAAKHAQEVAETIEKNVQLLDNFDPAGDIAAKKGLFQKVAISDAIYDCDTIFNLYEKYLHKSYEADYAEFYEEYGEQIENRVPEALSIIEQYKPRANEKYQKKYKILKCYEQIENEIDETGGENLRKLNENNLKQAALNEKVKVLQNELYGTAKVFGRFFEETAMVYKAMLPFCKTTKEEAAAFKAKQKEQLAELKKMLSEAKKDKKEKLPGLKAEAAQMKKEGDKLLSGLKKKLARFKNYKPKKDEFETELAKLGL